MFNCCVTIDEKSSFWVPFIKPWEENQEEPFFIFVCFFFWLRECNESYPNAAQKNSRKVENLLREKSRPVLQVQPINTPNDGLNKKFTINNQKEKERKKKKKDDCILCVVADALSEEFAATESNFDPADCSRCRLFSTHKTHLFRPRRHTHLVASRSSNIKIN